MQVFSPEVMEVFLVRTVLPKLAYCLQTLVINPKQQQIGTLLYLPTYLPLQSSLGPVWLLYYTCTILKLSDILSMEAHLGYCVLKCT